MAKVEKFVTQHGGKRDVQRQLENFIGTFWLDFSEHPETVLEVFKHINEQNNVKKYVAHRKKVC